MAKKKQETNKGTAIWINEFGAIKKRVFEIVKEFPEEKKVIISFGNNEVYKIKKRNIRIKRVLLYKTASGDVKCQDPDKWGDVNLTGKGIKALSFNSRNSSLQEAKASNRRWILPRDTVDKLIPVFRLMFICIAIGVIGWACLKLGIFALERIASARLQDCAAIIPKPPVPLGVNASAPIA